MNANIPKNIISILKLEGIAIDFIRDLITTTIGNKHILVLVDICTKFIKLYPCQGRNVQIIKNCFQEYFNNVGKPQK